MWLSQFWSSPLIGCLRFLGMLSWALGYSTCILPWSYNKSSPVPTGVLWALTCVEADLLPSPPVTDPAAPFSYVIYLLSTVLAMRRELNIVCWQWWGVRRLRTRWQLIVAGVRPGELQPHEIFALDSLAAPRAPRCPALRHSINIFQAGNIFNPISRGSGMIALLLAVTWTHEIQIDTW